MDFIDLSAQCAPNVAPQTMAAIVTVESSHNPYAIGVVGGRLIRQPTNKAEAIATAQSLEKQGKNFSMGMAQVNRHNLPRYNVTYSEMFDACTNLKVGALILQDCYSRALPIKGNEQEALRAAFSCYYSGNFSRGFKPDKAGDPSYVQKVLAASGTPAKKVFVPAINAGTAQAVGKAEKGPVLFDPVLIANEMLKATPETLPAENATPSQDTSAVTTAASSALVF